MKDNGKNEKTAKGVRKYVIKKNITHENYKDCLLNRKQMLHRYAQLGVSVTRLAATN